MKVKNRAIGSVCELVAHGAGKYITEFAVENEYGETIATYDTIDELQEYWETYKPKEPLIQDEKIRKAVRAWAESNDIDADEHFYVTSPTFDNKFLAIEDGGLILSSYYDDESIKDGSYTIDELCGEEEK